MCLLLCVATTVGCDVSGTGVETADTRAPRVADRRGWELDASNTGLAGVGLRCEDLPVYGGGEVVPAGAVISRVRVTTPLTLSGGVVIEQSCVQPTEVGRGLPVLTTIDYNSVGLAEGPVVIRDSDIDGSLLDQYSAAWATGFVGVATLQRNRVKGLGSGIALMSTGGSLSAVVEGNYVDGLVAWGDPGGSGNHSDAFTVRDFDVSATPERSLVVRDNRFVCDSGNDTGAVFIQTYSGDIGNVTLSGNLLEGRGFQLGLEAGFGYTYSNMRAVGNRFSGTSYGPTYRTGGPGWADWSDNRINAPGVPDNAGPPVPPPRG